MREDKPPRRTSKGCPAAKESRMPRNLLKTVLALAVALTLLGTPAFASDSKSPSPPQPVSGTLHVLTVGVARAKNKKKEAELPGADQNARDVAAFFKNQEGRLYEKVVEETLVNEEATHADILAALDRLKDGFKPGDTAVVHLSGHGGEALGQWRMAAHDHPWDNRSLDNMVTEKELRERLEKLPGKVILILDSCHAGAFGDGVGNRRAKGEAGLTVYAASLPDQVSYYSPALKHGVFTHALLEALDGKADANGDGIVTLAEVDAYVGARVAELGRPNLATKVVLGFRGIKATPQTPTLSKPATIPSNMPMAFTAPPAPVSHPIGS
jgi:hypothetical protein